MSRQQQQQQLVEGLDAYLQRVGKDLPVGGTVRLRLVQGPLPVASVDPVEPSASSSTSASSSSTSIHHKSIPKQHFPSILKFPPSSTQPPNFTQAPWNTGQGRLHLEPVPKPPDDSDEEEEAADRRNTTLPAAGKKKRWKYNRPVHPNKQWIVQDQVDFLETMVYRRKLVQYQKLLAQYRKQQQQQQHAAAAAASVAPLPPPPPKPPVPPPVRATRYVGVPERMTGHHVLFTLAAPPPRRDTNDDENTAATIIVRTLPSLEQPIMVPMTQPAVRSHRAFATLSGAAQVMEDQRFAMSTASLAFRKAASANSFIHNNNNNNHPDTGTTLRVGGIRKINPTQSRLLQKLQQKEKASQKASQKAAEEDDGDDVMADVAYKERKGGSGGGGAARRELLSTLGDGLKVSDDGGVLGGTNDALFGGRGLKFNRVAVSAAPVTGTNDPTERGADGAAMSDDFYTRDVGAEYEEMDYDAAEQFDDDDVDVGETEMTNVGNDGYNEDEDDEDNDDASEDMNDDNDDAIGGAEGLASMAGYKALLAKARGEIQAGTTTEKVDDSRSSSPTGNANANNNSGTSGAATLSTTTTSTKNGDDHTKRSVSPKPDKNKNSDDNQHDHLAKKSAAAEKAAQALKKKESILSNGGGGGNHAAPTAAPAVDEHGLRLITLDAVRKEIWLNHGSIPINRLIKIFNANKKHGEVRQNQLKEVIKELCTMTTDPIQGRVLVLKQHYSHMS